jgi:hypothetical protein
VHRLIKPGCSSARQSPERLPATPEPSIPCRLTSEQNLNIVSTNKGGTAMTAYVKDIAAFIVVTTFIASIGVVSETLRMLL